MVTLQLCWCRYEKIEEAKKEMRKKAELEKRFEKNGDAGAGSDDSDVEDEDKIAEQEEAGEQLHHLSCRDRRLRGVVRCMAVMGRATDAVCTG